MNSCWPAPDGFIALLCNGIANVLGRGCLIISIQLLLGLCGHDLSDIAETVIAYTMQPQIIDHLSTWPEHGLKWKGTTFIQPITNKCH